MAALRILGVDPGSRMTGVGIIDVNGDRITPVYYDAIKAGNGEFTARLGIIFNELQQLIKQYRPDQAAIETVFVANNASSAIKLGQARGAAICAGVTCSVPVDEYAAREVKQAVVGKGGATKEQVQHMICVLLSLSERPPSDAADALAVAICHGHVRATRSRLATMQPLQGGRVR